MENEVKTSETKENLTIPILTDNIEQIPVYKKDKHENRVRLFILILAILYFIPNAGAFGLWDPWETHYGAVTMNMIETYDWFSPWWGYKEKIGNAPIDGHNFFSKPIYTFWAEATFMRLIGYSEWAIRLPMALIAIIAVFFTYFVIAKLFGRRKGIFSAIIVATSPQFFIIARQAQTDMPFVGTLTVAMLFFLLALYGKREIMSNKKFWTAFGLTIALLILSTLPQYGIIAMDFTSDVNYFDTMPTLKALWFTIFNNGLYHVIFYLIIEILILISLTKTMVKNYKKGFTEEFKDRELRKFYLIIFYIMIAHSTLAKGLLGFMLPGFIVFVYLLITWEWKLLKRISLFQGFLIFMIVAFPWYVGMLCKHGMAYFSRFFIHDHFNRLAAGVHEIDTGNFEHFIKWLGLGMFPWTIFVPFVFIKFVKKDIVKDIRERNFYILTFLWFFLSYALFTLAKTKFHHYIFPALPPLAILIGMWLDEFIDLKGWMKRAVILISIGFFVALTIDLYHDPQHIRNLCTYKYDRPLPKKLPINKYDTVAPDTDLTWEHSVFYKHTNSMIKTLLNIPALEYKYFIPFFIGIPGLIGLLLMLFYRARKIGLFIEMATASLLLFYTFHYYMPMLSPHWSQKYLFEDYFSRCHIEKNDPVIEEAYTPLLSKIGLGFIADYLGNTPKRVCKEDIISWLLTWRGETYYSYNEIQPINNEQQQFEAYLTERNKGKTFYIFMQNRGPSYFQSKMDYYQKKLVKKKVPEFMRIKKWKVEKIHYESKFFTLMKATPIYKNEQKSGK